jgi:hypothetical protein
LQELTLAEAACLTLLLKQVLIGRGVVNSLSIQSVLVPSSSGLTNVAIHKSIGFHPSLKLFLTLPWGSMVFFKINLKGLIGASVAVLDQLPGNCTSQAFHAGHSEQDENSKPCGTA